MMAEVDSGMNAVEFGKLIQRRRESIGMSREELAAIVGSKYEVIRLYEEGKRVMKIDRFFAILDALGIPSSDCLLTVLGGNFEKVHPLSLLARIRALDSTSYQRLIYLMNAFIEMEDSGHL